MVRKSTRKSSTRKRTSKTKRSPLSKKQEAQFFSLLGGNASDKKE